MAVYGTDEKMKKSYEPGSALEAEGKGQWAIDGMQGRWSTDYLKKGG